MRIWSVLLMFLFLSPAVLAIGILIPPEFSNLTKVYTNQPVSIVVPVKGDSSTKTITFFANSPSPSLLINGVQSYSRTMTVAAAEIKDTTLQLTGSAGTGELTVEYGFILGASGNSSGIGFQQVTKDTFKARVYCVGSCSSPTNGGNTGNSGGGSGGGGGGGAYIPLPLRNQSNSSPVVGPAPVPVVKDIAGQESGVDTAQVDAQQPSQVPKIDPTGEVQKIANVAVQKGGRAIALFLVGMFISLLVLEVVVYRVAKRMPD